MKLALLVVIFFVSEAVWSQSLQTKQLNDQAIAALQKKEPDVFEAKAQLLKAIEGEPFNPLLRMNLALAYLLDEQAEKAESEAEQALKMISKEDEKGQFIALFNLAWVQAKAQKIDEALANYQKALSYQPDSKEVKKNIELLMQQQQQQGKGGKSQQQQQQSQGKEQQDQDGQGDQDQEQKDQNQGEQQQPKQNESKQKQFKSKELSESDVRKILEELKNQEQKIRAQDYKKGAKERPDGKDW